MKSNPKISVLLPHYQDLLFVTGAIEAIINQSYPPHEVIVIDDGSKDGSAEILRDFCKRDSRIHFHQNEKNNGVSYTVERALSLSTGDFIYAASSDDRILPGFFENVRTLIEKSPDSSLIISQTYLFYSSSQEILWVNLPPSLKTGYYSPSELCNLIQNLNFFFPGNTAIYHKETLLSLGGFRSDFMCSADSVMIVYIALTRGLNFIDQPFGIFQIKEGSFTSKVQSSRCILKKSFESLLEFLYENKNTSFTSLIQKSGYLGSMPIQMIAMALLSPRFLTHATIANLKLFLKSIPMRTIKKINPKHEHDLIQTPVDKNKILLSAYWPKNNPL
jgi:glycosyltransferase involved in cell wall biosynthesis